MKALILVALVACSATARHTALSTTTASLDAAQVMFVAFDGEHQLAIVAACPVADGKAACDATLAKYRAERAKVLVAVVAAYRAVAAAWKLDNASSLAAALQYGIAVEQALKSIGVTP
ncbi:MAG: hypothetical protein H0X39_00820 [Actinobacteria bacterium]|nr:hypothetical protein [Actinomycetota bacterium]